MQRPSLALLSSLLCFVSADLQGQSGRRTITLTLTEAVEIAQEQGPWASAVRSTLDAARAAYRSYSARQLPQISVSAQVPSYNRAIIPAPQPDGSLQFRPQELTNSTANLQVTQEIPWTGTSLSVSSRLAQLKRTGAAETWSSTPFSVSVVQPILRSNTMAWTRREQQITADIAERTYQESMEDVASGTAKAFLQLYATTATLRDATDNLARADTLKRIADTRFAAGAASMSEVRQAELGILRARLALSQATLARDEADANLRALLGFPLDVDIDVDLPGEPPAIDADTGVAVAAAMRNRADLRQFDLRDLLARRAESEARFDRGPGANLTASYGYNATAGAVGDAYDDLLERQSLDLYISFPVWQWGAGSADLEVARASRSAAQATARQSRDQIRRDVIFTIRRLAQARSNLAIAAQADTIAADHLRGAIVRWTLGRFPMENLFVALNDRDQAAQQRIASLVSFWTAYYQLRRATMYDFTAGRDIRRP